MLKLKPPVLPLRVQAMFVSVQPAGISVVHGGEEATTMHSNTLPSHKIGNPCGGWPSCKSNTTGVVVVAGVASTKWNTGVPPAGIVCLVMVMLQGRAD